MNHAGVRILLALCVCVLQGCSASRGVDEDHASRAPIGSRQSHATTPPSPITQSPPLLPSAPAILSITPVTPGQRAFVDETGTRQLRTVTLHEGSGRYRVSWFIDGEPEPSRQQLLAISADGALTLLEEINAAERVEVVFTPALLVVPAELRDGAVHAQIVRMTVHPLGDRTRTRSAGDAHNTLTINADRPLTIRDKSVLATRISAVMEVDLAPAKVLSTSEQWYAPGAGLVRDQQEETTAVLGIPVRSNRQAWTVQDQ